MKKILLLLFFPFFLCAETEFLLIRHGETDWNLENRLQGVANNSLNETGIKQAQDLSKKLLKVHPDITALYSSDLQRAHLTATAAADKFHLPIQTSPNFREYDWGEIDGLKVEEKKIRFEAKEKQLKEQIPSRRDRWDVTIYPGSETFNQLLHRFSQELTLIADEHPDEKVAIFTHARAIRLFLSDLLDVEFEETPALPNCAVVHIAYSPEDPQSPFRLIEVANLLN